MAAIFASLHRVFIQGLSKENSVLLKVQTKHVHSRFINQYGTIGLLAMLVKTITMAFVAMLGEFRPYFEIHDYGPSSSGAPAAHISTQPMAPASQPFTHVLPHIGFLARPGGGGDLHWGTKPVVWEYHAYVFLLMFSTLFIFVSMMTSVGNYLALSLIDEAGLKHYLKRVGVLADLPFLSLIWGVTMWHIALIVLMFYIVDFRFGVIFGIGCSFSIVLVIYSVDVMLDAVDFALVESEKNSKTGEYADSEPDEQTPILGLS